MLGVTINRMVRPSGAALAAALDATMVAAPGRLLTTTGTSHFFARPSASERVALSNELPAELGTTRVTVPPLNGLAAATALRLRPRAAIERDSAVLSGTEAARFFLVFCMFVSMEQQNEQVFLSATVPDREGTQGWTVAIHIGSRLDSMSCNA